MSIRQRGVRVKQIQRGVGSKPWPGRAVALTGTLLPAYPSAGAVVCSHRPGPTGNAMNAAGARKRVEQLTALIESFRKESEALLAGRGVLTPEEWNHYAAAI